MTNLDNTLELLKNQGILAKKTKPFFGGELLTVKYKGINYFIRENDGKLSLEMTVPVWVHVIGVVLGMLLTTLILIIVTGEPIIAKGGFLVYFIGMFIGGIIYRAINKDKIQEFENFLESNHIQINK